MSAAAVYIASPLGFTEPGRRWAAGVLLPAVRAGGLEPLDPWHDPEDHIGRALLVADGEARLAALRAANAAVALRNVELIRAAQGLLAVLDGPDVDSGTAAEIGFAAALGLPVVGLRTDFRLAADNEGGRVNLQVEGFILQSGGDIDTEADMAVARLARLARLLLG